MAILSKPPKGAAASRGETTAAATTYILPDDIVLQIFPYLPKKALLRFKAVCRRWSSAIDDHLCNGTLLMINQPHKYVAMFRGDSRISHLHGAWRLSSRPVPSPILESNEYFLHSACAGLLCYVSTPVWGEIGYTVCVWNPLTKEVATVPELASPSRSSVFGLGRDDTTNTYKIVHIFGNGVDPDLDLNVEVYTLGTRSSWRKIQGKPRFPLGNKMPVFAAQALHWDPLHPLKSSSSRNYRYDIDNDSADNDISDEPTRYIVSFDVTSEVFYSTRHPKARKFHLVELNGRLAMVDQYTIHDYDCSKDFIAIWMLEENKFDWVKSYVIEIKSQPRNGVNNDDELEVMGTWNNGDDILLKTKVDGFFSYNIKRGKFKSVDIPVRYDNYRHVVGFRGSLFPLGSVEVCEICQSNPVETKTKKRRSRKKGRSCEMALLNDFTNLST